jgi:hypothetical protein
MKESINGCCADITINIKCKYMNECEYSTYDIGCKYLGIDENCTNPKVYFALVEQSTMRYAVNLIN